MKILVTGGAGYIGSVTAERLLDEGHDVVVFDNLERGHREALDPRAQFIKGDLRDSAAIERALARTRPEAVVHFAAYALVGESMQRPELYFGNNLCGGINLAEAMLKAGTRRIVFSSTCATYGQPDRIPITEDTPQAPANPYGESKLMLEKVLTWYQRLHDFQPVFLRYFNACGASEKYGEDHEPETHLIPNILKVALGQQATVSVFGDDYDTPDGTCIRDYIHITDLARAHCLSLANDFTGAVNLGTGEGCSVRQVVDMARRVTGHAIPVVQQPRRPGDPARLVAAAAKAERMLGWRPEHSQLEEIVRSAWAWHRAHPHGYGQR
ncbi:MAG: UDP-glucose 4-epimerase GalE [Kiritimatiellae bacterium]|nr:UDP-glucose 4-epimerase GalE [Kiritimatiellia bacterium]